MSLPATSVSERRSLRSSEGSELENGASDRPTRCFVRAHAGPLVHKSRMSASQVLRADGLALARADTPLDVCFSVRIAAFQRVALRGPSGVGKSTALRTLVGFETAASGTITLDGRTPEAWGWPQFRQRVCYVQQVPGLFSTTVGDNLQRAFDYASQAHQHFDEAAALALLDAVGLHDCWDRAAKALSGGERSRLGLVRGLLLEPTFLLADEPSAGLDADSARVVAGQLVAASEAGMGILVVSHDAEFIKALAPTSFVDMAKGPRTQSVALGGGSLNTQPCDTGEAR